MRYLFLSLIMSALLTGCGTFSGGEQQNDETLLDRLEFDEGQEGCLRATGEIATGANPFLQSTLNVNLIKKQGDNAPDC